MKWFLVLGLPLLSSRINITASLQPENTTLAGTYVSSDCVPIILGFAYGSASLEGALANESHVVSDYHSIAPNITKIRRVQLHDHVFLGFGARCIEVVGE